jgi:hypothetical protein
MLLLSWKLGSLVSKLILSKSIVYPLDSNDFTATTTTLDADDFKTTTTLDADDFKTTTTTTATTTTTLFKKKKN